MDIAEAQDLALHENQIETTSIEEFTADQELREFLTKVGAKILVIKADNSKEKGWPDTIKIAQFTHNTSIEEQLPQGYFFAGGRARNIALQSLGDQSPPTRDTDINAILDFHPDKDHQSLLSKEYMHRDYKYGHGVVDDSLYSYFNTRDFTINEALANGETIYVTAQGLQDLKYKIIRPTLYEKGQWFSVSQDKMGIKPKLAVKALRIYLQFKEAYRRAAIKDIEEWQFKAEAMPLFSLAIGLNKANENGPKILSQFYRRLLELGTIEPMNTVSKIGGFSSTELAMNINAYFAQHGGYPFIYTDEEWNKLEEDKELDTYYDDLAEYYTPLIERASRERPRKKAV